MALWVLEGGSNQGVKWVKREATRLKTVEKRNRKPLLCFFYLRGHLTPNSQAVLQGGEAQLPQACDTVELCQAVVFLLIL